MQKENQVGEWNQQMNLVLYVSVVNLTNTGSLAEEMLVHGLCGDTFKKYLAILSLIVQ